ncbi:MAG: hypothetical protein GEU78_18230 [Actinobacteria bacterium]|nr:hypothetical protein [Actinomycetota bacterium]
MPATAGSAHTSLADVAGLLGNLPPADTAPEVVLLDGTRAGAGKLGVGVNLAVGLVGRSGPLRRRRARTVWLGATTGEPWSAMARQLDTVAAPKLVVVDGEETITDLVTRLWARHAGAALLVASAAWAAQGPVPRPCPPDLGAHHVHPPARPAARRLRQRLGPRRRAGRVGTSSPARSG